MSGRRDSVWVEPIYLDASALVKLLVPEPQSDRLNRSLIGAGDVIVSDLSLTETVSALGRRMREGRLTPHEARRLWREATRVAAACRHAELTPPTHRRAERLLLAAGRTALRSLDALHIALALDAGAATMVTFDLRLAQVASTCALFVAPEPAR